jgi:mannose-1-phosphate guanylyltransferase
MGSHVFVVIMAGGSGTRFWPLSRKGLPKQFLKLVGPRPLLVESAQAAARLAPAERTLVVTGAAHASLVRQLLPRLPARNVLAEPCGRNTAPAIALAALHAAARDPDAVLAVLTADHHMADAAEFTRCCKVALAEAGEGKIATLGIRPTRPDTGFGYIRVASPARPGIAVPAKAFLEKPDQRRARRFVADGRHLWNSGMFFFKASVLLDEVREQLPDLYAGMETLRPAIGTRGYGAVLRMVFPSLPDISIDYGIMEKARSEMAVVPSDFGWDDVGSFAALLAHAAADNYARGTVVAIDTTRSVLVTDRGVLAAVGLDGLAVVRSGDAVLVLRLDRCQDVRQIVRRLQESGRGSLT